RWPGGVIVLVARLSRLARVLLDDGRETPVSNGEGRRQRSLHDQAAAGTPRPDPGSRERQRRLRQATLGRGSQRADDDREHQRRKPDELTVSILIEHRAMDLPPGYRLRAPVIEDGPAIADM